MLMIIGLCDEVPEKFCTSLLPNSICRILVRALMMCSRAQLAEVRITMVRQAINIRRTLALNFQRWSILYGSELNAGRLPHGAGVMVVQMTVRTDHGRYIMVNRQ